MKKVGGNWYMHKTNLEAVLTIPTSDRILLLEAINYFYEKFDNEFEVIKYNPKKHCFSLIEVIEFDALYEPIVGASYFFPQDFMDHPGKIRVIPGGRMVYHQKHLFVDKSYNKFNIEESIKRTKLLENIAQVKQFKCKIGSLEYWRGILDLYDLPYYMQTFLVM